jgi:hypothetical protein
MVLAVQPIKNGQGLIDVARGSHRSKVVFGVPRRQGPRAQIFHQFVGAKAAPARQ